MRPTLLILSLLALGCPTKDDTADETGDSSAPLEAFPWDAEVRLDEVMQVTLEDYTAAGLQLAVSLPGHERYLGYAGMADLDAEAPMAAGHVSKAGSITKTLVAALVLRAVDESILSLDDSLSTWIPDQPWGSEITLRHVLQHSSGLPEYAGTLELAGDQDEAWELADLVALVETQALTDTPGTIFSYANTNYVLLGMVLEAANGGSWADQAQALLDEVGEGQLVVPSVDWGEVVPGYCMLPDGSPYEHDTGTNFVDYWHPSAIGPAGNLVADAEGLAALGTALWVEQRLISTESVAAMAEESVGASDTLDYGLGMVVDNGQTPVRWFHNGAVTGYAAWLELRPEDGAVVAIMANSWVVEGGSFSSDWLWDVRDRAWEALDGSSGD